MEVELLKSEDIVSYKALIDECFGASNGLEKYKKYHENESYKIFVVKDGDIVAGSITQYSIDLFIFEFQPSLLLFNIAVKKEYRKQNIAKKILEYIIENARKDGYKSISVTCLGTAYPAHKLYESVGFKKTDNIKFEIDLVSAEQDD